MILPCTNLDNKIEKLRANPNNIPGVCMSDDEVSVLSPEEIVSK